LKRKQTYMLDNVYIGSTFSSVGSKESEGPLAAYFDAHYSDDLLGQSCWEMAESTLMKNTLSGALTNARMTSDDIDMLFAGDLLNQCIASSFALKPYDIPFFGLYGACSTFVESIGLASLLINSGYISTAAAITSSHFCSSQKQYRFPLSYGEFRTPTSQWTVTGSGCAILTKKINNLQISSVTVGKMVDLGVTDANNMGAAMAPAAADTVYAHFADTGLSPDYYDLIITGDLADVGSELFRELMYQKGIDIGSKHTDCGSLIYDGKSQNVNSGGSGCGCIASVFSGYFSKKLICGELSRILLVATGALMSPSGTLVGEPITGIAHAAGIERKQI